MSLAFDAEAPLAGAPPSPLDEAGLGLDRLRFITCGSVDDGKSTLIGRLLYDSKSILDDQLEALDRDSRRFGTQGEALDLALLVDGLAAEREQGITIDVAYRYFATPRRSFIVADTPGHEQYTRNMATGASTAELAIILIDARKGILPQTRRHSFIVSMLGVRHVAVAVNKMDLIAFDRAAFDRICAVYRSMAKDLGFDEVKFFPISARDGDNVAHLSRKTPWYTGRALLDHLETVRIAPERTNDSLLFPVQWVNRPDHAFRGYAGVVTRGAARPGADVLVLPRRSPARIARVVGGAGDQAEASEGQSVTLTLDREIDVSRGDVIVSTASPPQTRRAFRAHILWTAETALVPEAAYWIKLGSALAQARIKIERTVDVHSFALTPAQEVTMNVIAAAEISCDRDLVALPYQESRELGGFILIDKTTNETAAFGLIEPETESVPLETFPLAALRARLAAHVARGGAGVGPSQNLVAYAASIAASAAVVLALTRRPGLAVIFACVEAILRPSVRDLCAKIFAVRAQRRENLNSDGAGI